MANTPKRPEKVVMQLITNVPSGLDFQESISMPRKSEYVDMLNRMLTTGGCVKVLAEDKYLINQFKGAAKKINLKLMYSVQGPDLYIKPVAQSEAEKRLTLLLRYPRSLSELQMAKLELHLVNTLERLVEQGIVHFHKNKYVLTEKGMDLVPSA